MKRIFKFLEKREMKKRRQLFKEQLMTLEHRYTNEGKWEATPEVMLSFLSLLKSDLIPKDVQSLNSVTLTCGFKNAEHLFLWLEAILKTLENRELPETELTIITRHRTVKRLGDFLTNNKAVSYPVDKYIENLEKEFIKIRSSMNTIQNPLFRDRFSGMITHPLRDIFASLEALATLGVNNEQ